MPTIRTTFEKVVFKASKSVKCKSCGGQVKRQKTFSQTMNPFNKSHDGLPKMKNQINIELKDEAIKWKTKSEVCRFCKRKYM